MMLRILFITAFVMCLFFFAGCTPAIIDESDSSEPVVPEACALNEEDSSDPAVSETRAFTASEKNFMDMLNAVGLSWEFSAYQLMRIPPEDLGIPGPHIYLIDCPLGFAQVLIVARSEGGSILGEEYIQMSFRPRGQLPEDEFRHLLQEGFMSTDELFAFFVLAGKAIGEEDDMLSIANRVVGYIDNFQFDYKTEDVVTIMAGHYGNIDYSFTLEWHGYYGRYFLYEMHFTAGLSDFFREHRVTIDF